MPDADVKGAALNAALLAAHAAQDKPALIALYAEAGDRAAAAGRIDAACFFRTQAYIMALELGAPQVEALRRALAAEGRV